MSADFNLFPHLTILRNLTIAPENVAGVEKQASQQRAVELLEMMGLADKADAYPAPSSGGPKQRMAIARALAMDPSVMLLDKVTSALDRELVGDVLEVLRKLAHEADMGMLIVTHEMDFARDIADRVLFFDQGDIVDQGPPAEVFTNPQNERTRGFLKRMLDH